jgi:hypothetical protein
MKKNILRFVFTGLVLKASDGSRLIYKAKKTFQSDDFVIDEDFANWKINNPGIVVPETSLQIHDLVGCGNFMDIFESSPGKWNQKWLTQNQVIDFCEIFPSWLNQGHFGNFVLIKKDENKPVDENKPEDNLVVVVLRMTLGGLSAHIYNLECDNFWPGRCLYRVISPAPIVLQA